MILLRLISWPYLRRHLLRTVLTTTGIVLGVAVFVALHTANQSVLFAFNTTIDRIAGKTQLQVTAGEAGFGEEVLERVQAVESVGVAVPVIEAVVETRTAGEGSLLVLGTDMTGDRSLRDYEFADGEEAFIDDPLIFLAQADSIMVAREFADRNGLSSGSRIELGTVLGPRPFTIRGVMKSEGLATAYGGNLAIMDIYAAQLMFGRGRTFDRIDLAVREGYTVAEVRDELTRLLGPGFTVDTPAGRGRQFESMTAAYSVMVTISSLFVLVIGMFIIYNAFEIAVTQRRAEIGVLRAIGATRGQIRWLFLSEGALTGLVGSIVGLGVGLLVARGIVIHISGLMHEVYGVAQHAEEVATHPLTLGMALAIGVATSLVGALIPARQAAHVDPVLALQKGKYQVLSAGEGRLRAQVAAAGLAIALACLLGGSSRLFFYIGYASLVVSVLLLGPLLTLGLARLLRPALKALWPVEGALAADSLIQAPRRTSACVAAVLLSLALAVSFSGMSRAAYDSIAGWVDSTLQADFYVAPSRDIVNRAVRFPAEMQAELEAIPHIERVQPVRSTRILYKDTPVLLTAIEFSGLPDRVRSRLTAGEPSHIRQQMHAGEGLLVSDNFARLQQVGLGDVLEVTAPHGIIRLPVVGVLIDYTDQQGTILMSRDTYTRYWRDDSVNLFRLYLDEGASVDDVRQRIFAQYDGTRQVFVFTNGDVRNYVLGVAEQWLSLSSIQIAIAVLVAILGIVNTLTVSITDRRRELGVLRAIGGLAAQIRLTIWLEAISIGLLGLLLGIAFGAINLHYTLQIAERDVAGFHVAYLFPVTMALTLLPTILAAAFLAAIWPAEAAVRGSLVEALEYE